MYLAKTSLIWTSWLLKEEPVVYHPKNFSFWLIYTNINIEYLLHHGKHSLVIQVIEKPDIALTWIFFEWKPIAIHHLNGVIIYLTQQSPHNSLASLLKIDSIEMVDDGEEDQRMYVYLRNLCFAHLKNIWNYYQYYFYINYFLTTSLGCLACLWVSTPPLKQIDLRCSPSLKIWMDCSFRSLDPIEMSSPPQTLKSSHPYMIFFRFFEAACAGKFFCLISFFN